MAAEDQMQATRSMKNPEPLATHSSISEMYVANNQDNQLTITERSRTSYTAKKNRQTFFGHIVRRQPLEKHHDD